MPEGVSTEGGAVRYIGTRWSYADTYREILARGAAIERRHPATIDGTAGGEPVLFSKERLAETRQRMGPYTFAAQFLLDPAAERDQAFHDDWLRYFDPDEGSTDEMRKYLLVDPASSKKKGSDYTVMAVIGLGADQNYYLLDAVRDRLNLTERGDKLLYRWARSRSCLLRSKPDVIRSPTTTSPVAMPTRAWSLTDLTSRRPTALITPSPVRTARSASSSRALG
jgi:hypothetical protein